MGRTQRFIFEDRSLDDWLLQLVDTDPVKRQTAARVVTCQFYMPDDLLPQTRRGVEQFLEEFSEAVRQVVNLPNFPTEQFVRCVLSLDLALHESWCAKSRERWARNEKLLDAELGKLSEDATPQERARCFKDYGEHLAKQVNEEPHEVFTTGMALVRVIESLGSELLPAADILRTMLRTQHKAYLASDAIGRMGRRGLEFYDDLVAGLERDWPNFYHARALGAVLRKAPEKILEILQLACDRRSAAGLGAIYALGFCGRPASGAYPEVEVQLRTMLQAGADQDLWYHLVLALGNLGRTDETVEYFLELLESADRGRAGELINALGQLALKPERVVPRLVELLDTYEEYNPDYCYHGEHERVVGALEPFGSSAAEAVPALIHHIWTQPQTHHYRGREPVKRREPDEAVIELLGKLGPVASSALPHLLEVQAELRRRAREESDQQDDDSDEPQIDSFVDIAIKQVRGEPVES